MNKKLILAIVCIYLIMGLISIFSERTEIDELGSHLPTVENFYTGNFYSALTGEGYKSASSPLPYIIAAGMHEILNLNPTLASLRIINIFISILTIIVLLLLFKRYSLPYFPFLLIFFFYPYFIKPSFVYYMAGYGLLFFFLFIYLLEKPGVKNQVFSGLFLTCAVLSQQFYLILFAPLLIYKIKLKDSYKNLLREVFVYLITSIPILLLFFMWGGLTHPSYKNWGIKIHPEYISAVLVVAGGVLLPFVLLKIKEVNIKLLVIFFLLSVTLAILIFPDWVSEPTPGGIAGYTFHIIAVIENISFVLGTAAKATLIFSGITGGYLILKSGLKEELLLKLLFICFSVGFLLNKLPSERHMLPLAAVAMLLAFRNSDKNFAFRYWLPYQAAAGVVYFVYILI